MLVKYKDKGDILIMGDLNTRTGNKDGLHEKLGKQLKQPTPRHRINYFGNWQQVFL